ncbi:hypothetical protein K0U83_17680 [bacterium]|nr:hypothetical protein [bacterium]
MRLCIAIIWAVTAFDVGCNQLAGEMLYYNESAPMTRSLLEWLWQTWWSHSRSAPVGPVAVLSALKVVGTFVVTEILRELPDRFRMPVAIGVAASQAIVLALLCLPDAAWESFRAIV